MCGPECLGELLRREGKPADLALLAREAATSHEGTTLLALARTAGRHGIPLKGMQLTEADFRKQALPLLALVAPGHIVIVDQIDRACVTVWDPAAAGPGKAATKDIVWPQWRRMWRGVALVRANVAGPAPRHAQAPPDP
jgi:ABC-type bacteriocin/lantibiotic exporter with double-glycine peptidase domain